MNGHQARKIRRATVDTAKLALDSALKTMASQHWKIRLRFAWAILWGNVDDLMVQAYRDDRRNP